MGCAASSDTNHQYNNLGHGHENNRNYNDPPAADRLYNHNNVQPTPARDPTPPPRDPTPPPKDPTPPPPRDPTPPPPRDPTPPPKDPTPPPPRDPTPPPPRDPTPPPKDPTPPPPRDPTPPPPRDPTPPPPSPPPKDPTPPPRTPTSPVPPPPEPEQEYQEELTPAPYPSHLDGMASPVPPTFESDYTKTNIDTYEIHVDFRKSPEDYDYEQLPVTSGGCLYEDLDFPLDVALPSRPNGIEWKRPTEIRSRPVLFSDGTTRYDIGQGSIGTCWFLSMVSVIADKPSLIRQVIPRNAYPVGTPEYKGMFHCRFWRYGIWDDVYIDDNLPIVYGDKVYSAHSATDENEMWVALLEKAFARSYGSYEAVTGGLTADSFIALTAGVPEMIDIQKGKTCGPVLFKRIRNAISSGAMVACTVPDKYDNHQGLVGGHAYSLTGTAMGNDTQLIRVRNPWGKHEWTGPWSDGSSEWSSVPEGAVQRANVDDGEFYMSLDDFMTYFSDVTICCLTPDFDRDGSSDTLNYVTCLYGDWRGKNAAGFQKKLENPKYLIEVTDKLCDESGNVPIVLQIIQRTHQRKRDKISIRCDLYKVLSSSGGIYVVDELGENTNSYKQDQQASFRYLVTPGRYIVLPSAIEDGLEKEFMVRVFSSGPLSCFENLTEDESIKYMLFDRPDLPQLDVPADTCFCQCLPGAFISGVNAGGQVSNDTVGNNPQFRLTVNQRGLARFQLMQEMKEDLMPLGFRMWRVDDGTFPLTTNWIWDNYSDDNKLARMTDNDDGKFVVAKNVSADYVLDPGQYVILIHLDGQSQETKFVMMVESHDSTNLEGAQLAAE
ncbi:calpain-2 catalytic subunit-like isoform X2 [Pecten maximus]|uniref:calpain-2 catalytic subunit-like isoform X2 n=1 Tax=Pecten maximus TaxID=6579 RepID=UPI001458921C|nr:calpain-2 catalytic subunit-like isoform X2 [Pecten maximus]